MTMLKSATTSRDWRHLFREMNVPIVDRKSTGNGKDKKSVPGSIKYDEASIIEGSRNVELASIAGRLRHFGATESEITRQLLEKNATDVTPPLSEVEVRSIATSVARYEPAHLTGAKIEDVCEETRAGALKLIADANREFAVVTVGSSVVILREMKCADGLPDGQLLTESGFRLLTKNWPRLMGEAFSNHWLQSPSRREYDGLVFDPSGKSPENFYNLFRGFSTTPKSGACHLYLRFVRDVICAGDAELDSYVINWMAHLIQRPQELPEVALVLRSGQGTGKNTLVKPLARILGQMFYECTNMERLTGKFNNHLKDKLLVHANEATWGGNKSAEGTLKAMITDSFRAVEPKGKDIITVRNCSRLIISSNEEWPVACGPDDRRFVFLDVSEVHKQDHAYFKAVYEELKSGGVEALHDHLLKVDIDGWHPRQRPKPRFGADVKIRSLDLVGRWLYETLESGVISSGDDYIATPRYPWGTEPKVPRDTIVASVEAFARKQLRRESVPDRGALFKRVYKLCDGVTETRRERVGRRERCCVFPTLDECRRSFEKAINCEGLIDWSEVEGDDN
ncbi:MAG: DUF5906 domain-containing protein [Haliea sp.]|uniref:DUF5906 domain-containing protein n=1 Tax=Haliea sp. TaxID=1932666 RepID=UPI0032ECB5D2